MGSHYREHFQQTYENTATLVGDTLQELERSTTMRAENALSTLWHHDKWHRAKIDNDFLREMAEELNVSHFYVTDKEGRFILSTNKPIAEYDYTLFDICPDYREMTKGTAGVTNTPLVPGKDQKFGTSKFVMQPSHDRQRVLEVAIETTFILDTLKHAFDADKNIQAMTLYTPSGRSLGRVTNKNMATGQWGDLPDWRAQKEIRWGQEQIIFSSVVPAGYENCCECKIKGVSSETGKYFYVLKMDVSTAPLLATMASTKQLLFIILAVSLFLSLGLAHWIARRLGRRVGQVNDRVREIMEIGDARKRIEERGKDEIGQLARQFDQLMESLHRAQEDLLEVEKRAAVAQTTKMLAHDVRKAFAIVHMVLDTLKDGGDPDEIQRIAAQSFDVVKKAMVRVDHMLADIMDIGADLKLDRKPLGVQGLLVNALEGVFQLYSEADVQLDFVLMHKHKIHGDEDKLSRVLQNIIENGTQAMSQKGWMRFDTKEFEQGGEVWVELRIGNNGPPIDQADLAKVFRPFFTKGKRQGTGLGLAICKSLIEAHGGNITCRASVGEGTQFFDSVAGGT